LIWVFVGVATILSCEIFFRLSVLGPVAEIMAITRKVARVLKSKSISDHWKESVLPKYSFRIFNYSILFITSLAIALLPFLLTGLLASLIHLDISNFIFKPLSMIAISVFALGYSLIRKKFDRKPTYSLTSKLLHYLALNSNIRCELYFDLEKIGFLKKTKSSVEDHPVFVCGLARAGTTILMRALYQTEEFSSLTYRDMPFVLAPNAWSRLTRISNRSMRDKMRAHKDGIFVNYDSPEALEEVFWRVFVGKNYIGQDYLRPHEIDPDVVASFRDYVALINRRHTKNRYLSKNNNNILRLQGITEAFPNATILIPFREPIQQAYSLLKQHQRFLAQHRKDRFSEKYMTWLVHHEFGLGHRPFKFNHDRHPTFETNTLDYWLNQWIHTYSYLLEKIKSLRRRIVFVSYEGICQKDGAVWQSLLALVKISKPHHFNFLLSQANAPAPTNDRLWKEASEIHHELLAASRQKRLDAPLHT